jgi:maleamate amidohydrolase
LLVVDFVNGFADPQVLGGGNIRDAIAAAAPLLAFFRERKLPVIFTRIVYAEDDSDARIWCKKAPRLRLLTESADVTQIVSELSPRGGSLRFERPRLQPFSGRTSEAS